MNENNSAEMIPDEHNEAICSQGEHMCHECRCAAADIGPA